MSVRILTGDCRESMAAMDADSIDSCVTDLAAGIAAEHLVCADLLLSGYRAFLADQNCPYDVAVEHDGRLIRVQVKATRKAKPTPGRPDSQPCYQWHARRAGKGGLRTYADSDFDVIALVALDVKVIAYRSFSQVGGGTIHLRPPGVETTHPNRKHGAIDCHPFLAALGGIGQ